MTEDSQAEGEHRSSGAAARWHTEARHTYDVIIRTCNSLDTARETVSSLRRQRLAPSNIIIVDSGSDPGEKSRLSDLADRFIDVSDRAFNYSYSINVALPGISSSHVLIISSHTSLLDDRVAEDLMRAMDDPDCAAAYLQNDAPGKGEWEQTRITASNFNSMNGLSNRCALVPMARLRDRPFREDVFACEDQVWAKSVFEDGVSYTLCIDTRRTRSAAPAKGASIKWANEQVALAYFVDRRRLDARSILRRIATGVVFALLLEWDRARVRFMVAYRLVKARSEQPSYGSKYD